MKRMFRPVRQVAMPGAKSAVSGCILFCLSVRLSYSCIVSKWVYVSSNIIVVLVFSWQNLDGITQNIGAKYRWRI